MFFGSYFVLINLIVGEHASFSNGDQSAEETYTSFSVILKRAAAANNSNLLIVNHTHRRDFQPRM